MRTILLLLLTLPVLQLPAGDWLPAGIHKGLTDEGGKHRFTIIVPPAAADGKEAPVVFILPGYTGMLDPYPWQPWADRRGCLVVALDDGLVRTQNGGEGSAGNAYANVPAVLMHFTNSIVAIGKHVQMQPFARIAVADRMMSPFAAQFAKAQGDGLGGLLLTRPWSVSQAAIAELPRHLGTFVLVGEHDAQSERNFLEVRSRLRNAGFATRSGYVLGGKANDWVPQEGCNVAVDHLLDLTLMTHPKVSPIKRLAFQEAILARGQQLAELDDAQAHDQLGWLLTVPGFEKQKKPIEALANRWVDAGIAMAKAKEAEDLVEAHERLSVVSKRPQAKFADAAHTKALLAELARMRKDKTIKAEIVAADLYANIVAMLEDDETAAKLKIALKQLEDLVAKHPATHAGKAGAKLLERVRTALR